jgi:hypothetical protein
MSKTITVEIECPDCGGTGLYIGFAEGDGTAVVCSRCNGSGKKTLNYKPFVKRNSPPKKVMKVFKTNIGYGLTLTSLGGMPVEDWNAGKPFPAKSEDREHSCPAWFYQSADYNKKPKWDWCLSCGAFPTCSHFPTRDKCWERWDKEFEK